MLKEDLKSSVEQGSFHCDGVNDILTTALEKQPSGSRVQGPGQSITLTMYFHILTASKLDMERMAIERKVFEEMYQMMMTLIDMVDANLNAYN